MDNLEEREEQVVDGWVFNVRDFAEFSGAMRGSQTIWRTLRYPASFTFLFSSSRAALDSLFLPYILLCIDIEFKEYIFQIQMALKCCRYIIFKVVSIQILTV